MTFRMDSVSEARLQEVIPALADRIRQIAQILASEGTVIRVVQGVRSWTQQDDLYAQGRTKPGNIVTNCPGGHSWHNFGCATDCVPSLNGLDAIYEPDWNEAHPTWQRMISLGTGLGLDSGATWRTFKDYPHFQLTGRFPEGQPDDEVRQLFKDGGMQGLWTEMGID